MKMQPDLWVEQQTVTLDADDLEYLANQLVKSPELPKLDPPIHGPRAGYLAKTLVDYEDETIAILTDIGVNPLAYGPLVYNLVISLARGDSVMDQVFRTTDRGPWQFPESENRNIARSIISERLRALRCARGEAEFPAIKMFERKGLVRKASTSLSNENATHSTHVSSDW